jgi:hypothetical protein
MGETLEVRQMLSCVNIALMPEYRLIDDGDPGYSEAGGDWQAYSESGALNGNFKYHAATSGPEAAASWTFDSLMIDAKYQIFPTWHESGNRATDSFFAVYDGDNLLAQVHENQQFAPNDAVLSGQNYESLGVFTCHTGSLRVELTSAASQGFVIADGMCAARWTPTTTLTTEIDDGDAAYAETGGWLGWSETAAADGDLRYCAPGDGSSNASWTFENVDPAKYYQVLSTWSASGNRSQESPFTILDGDTTLAVHRINQQFAPDDTVIDNRPYESLGVYQAGSGTLKVFLSNDVGSGYVVADKIRLEEVQPLEVAPTVIDDGDIGFSETGDSWRGWSESGSLNGDFRYAGGGTGGNYADWWFADLSAGKYNVYVTWHGAGNRATNSLFSVMQDENVFASTRIDQTAQPSGTTIDGQTWQSIGQVTIEDGALDLRLSDSDADGFVIADGARIELVDLAPTIGSLQGGPNPNIEDARLNLRAADVSDDDGEVVCVKYYRDINNDGILEPDVDQLLATDSDGSDGWEVNVSTAGFGTGTQRFFSQATDNEGLNGNVAAMTVSAGTLAVMDNSQPGYVETGEGWSTVNSSGDYLGSHREHSGGSVGEAVWTIQTVPGGYYKIFTTYTPGENMASNAQFEIYDGQTLVSTVTVDQRIAPNSEQDLGAWWQQLGSFVRINSGSITVKLKSDAADGAVAADAIRLYDDPFVFVNFTEIQMDPYAPCGYSAVFTISLSQCENQSVEVVWETYVIGDGENGYSYYYSDGYTFTYNETSHTVWVPLYDVNDYVTVSLTNSWHAFLPGYEHWNVYGTVSGGTDESGDGWFSDGEWACSGGDGMYLQNTAVSDEMGPWIYGNYSSVTSTNYWLYINTPKNTPIYVNWGNSQDVYCYGGSPYESLMSARHVYTSAGNYTITAYADNFYSTINVTVYDPYSYGSASGGSYFSRIRGGEDEWFGAQWHGMPIILNGTGTIFYTCYQGQYLGPNYVSGQNLWDCGAYNPDAPLLYGAETQRPRVYWSNWQFLDEFTNGGYSAAVQNWLNACTNAAIAAGTETVTAAVVLATSGTYEIPAGLSGEEIQLRFVYDVSNELGDLFEWRAEARTAWSIAFDAQEYEIANAINVFIEALERDIYTLKQQYFYFVELLGSSL